MKLLLAVSLLLALVVSCTDDDGESAPRTATPSATAGVDETTTATETATPTATAQPSATPDAMHLTGDAFIDRVIEAVEARDITALRSMVRLQETQCVSSAEGLGGPPVCNPDEPDGSTVAVFPVSSCEGAFTRYPGATLGSFVSAARGLYAVTESSGEPRSVPYWPVGDTYVVFHADRAGNDPGERLVLEDGAIVAVWFGCGPIEDTLSWRGEPLRLTVGPFDERAPAPPGPPVSGIEGVDDVIAAVTNYDLAALHEWTVLTTVPCVDRARDASEVACNPAKGEMPGDAVDVLPIVYCEGELSRDRVAAYTELLDLLPRVHTLQQSLADAQDDDVWVNGTYLLTLELSAPAEERQAAQLVLDNGGRIAVVRYNCVASVETLLARGGAEIPLTAGTPSPTATADAESAYRSLALGVEFRYPAAMDEPGTMCGPLESASEIALSNNISLTVAEMGINDLDDVISADLLRISAHEDRREATRLGGEDATAVSYRIANSGRGGTTTYAAHGGRIYRLVFELRNPEACGGIDPFAIYEELRTSLQFLN